MLAGELSYYYLYITFIKYLILFTAVKVLGGFSSTPHQAPYPAMRAVLVRITRLAAVGYRERKAEGQMLWKAHH